MSRQTSASMPCRISPGPSGPNSALRRGNIASPLSNFLQVFRPASPLCVSRKRMETAMLNHVSIGVCDIPRARKLYHAALKPLGYKALSEGETSLGYGKDAVVLWISKTEKPVPADTASGLPFCFDAATRRSVAVFHAAALGAGGKDNGEPGLRADYGPNYYAAFVVDPDGYRLEAYCGAAG